MVDDSSSRVSALGQRAPGRLFSAASTECTWNESSMHIGRWTLRDGLIQRSGLFWKDH
jgi:hypothetical protein